MTLTTERLKWLHDAATELSATKLKMTMRPDELLVLTSELLANREAQPVAWSYEWASCITCEGPQNFQPVIEREAPPEWTIDEGQARNIIPLYAAPPAPVVPVVQHEPVVYMWDSERKNIDAPGYYRPEHLFFAENSVKKWGGRVVPLYTAPPASAVPDGYCVMPLTLTAENGAKCALAGEFKVSRTVRCHECGGEGCDDCADAGEFEEEITVPWDTIKDIYRAAVDACRAAMLAQPVSGGYTLNSPVIPDGWKPVPVEPTKEMINAALAAGCASIRSAYREMLAAAPEGGNDHDTRR